MIRILLTVALCLLPSFASATINYITSLPTTIDINDVAGTNPSRNYADTFCLTSQGTPGTTGGGQSAVLIISGLRQIVLMRNPARSSIPYDTIYFDSADGISMTGTCDSNIIKNMAFVSTTDTSIGSTGATTGWSAAVIDGKRSRIDSCWFEPSAGAVAHGLYLGGAAGRYNQLVTRCVVNMKNMWYTSRCNYDATGIKAEGHNLSDTTYADFLYHVRVEYTKILNAPHAAIMLSGTAVGVSGGGVFQCYGCYVQPDVRNTLYPDYAGTCHSTSNGYGYSLRHAGGGSSWDTYIKSCSTVTGTTYGGGRAILIENTLHAPANNPIEISHNYADIAEGPNVEYAEDQLPLHALRIRNDPGHIRCDSNLFICNVDTASATTYRGLSANAVRLSVEDVATYDPADSTNIVGHDNVIVIRNRSAGLSYLLNQGLIFDDIFTDSVIQFYNTTCTSGIGIQLGTSNNGTYRQQVYGFEWYPADSLSTVWPIYIGHLSNATWYGEVDITDMSTPDDTLDDTAIAFSPSGRSDQGVALYRSFSVYVYGSNSVPVVGASVWVINAYGDTAFTGTTNTNGKLFGTAKYWEEFRGLTDSTAFNDFTLKAKLSTDSVEVTKRISQSASGGVDTLTLSATTGTGTESDNAPVITVLKPQGGTYTIATDTIRMILNVVDDKQLDYCWYYGITDEGDTIPFGKRSKLSFRAGESTWYDTLVYPLTDSTFLGTLRMEGYAVDTAGSFDFVTGSQVTIVSPTAQANTNPIISLITPSNKTYTVGDTAIFHVEVADTVGGLDSVLAWLSIDGVWMDTFYVNGALGSAPMDLSNTNWTWTTGEIGHPFLVVRAVDDSAGVTIDSSAIRNTVLSQVGAMTLTGGADTTGTTITIQGAALLTRRINLSGAVPAPPVE